ncbi:hypothetical protein QJR26_08885 [Clostridium baratii]
MNIEQAKSFFEKLPNKIPFKCLTDEFVNDYDRSLDVISKAIEREIPKNGIMIINNSDIKIGSLLVRKGVKVCKCVCGNILSWQHTYCNKCGQKLKWDYNKGE